MSVEDRTRTCEHRCYICDPQTDDERLQESERYIRNLVIHQRWIVLGTSFAAGVVMITLVLLLR
jgi:hypothetical protein